MGDQVATAKAEEDMARKERDQGTAVELPQVHSFFEPNRHHQERHLSVFSWWRA
jgi:hypothetical protein